MLKDPGAVPSVAYVAIGRCLPEKLRAKMMAILSTAWVVPGLAGPALSAEVARLFGWRWVFLGLLPFIAATAPFAIPALIRIGRPAAASSSEGHRLIDGVGPDGVSARVIDVTQRVIKLQTGYLYHYAFAMLIGVAALVTYYSFTGVH